MPTKYRPITKSEKTQMIGFGLLIAFIFAGVFSLIAPFIFQWAAGFFDPAPNIRSDCELSDFMDRPFMELHDCKARSNSFEFRMQRLSRKLPWFWIAFLFFSWIYTRNALKGRIRDDSDDVTYPGEFAWELVLQVIFKSLLVVLIWVFFARDKTSIIGLGICGSILLIWVVIHLWLRKNFGQTKAERQSE